VISSIGIGKAEFWNNLIKGKSGITKIESIDTSEYNRHFGGEIKNFNPEDFIDRRKLKRMGRASQFAIAATKLALKDAGLNLKENFSPKTAVIVGTTMADIRPLEEIDHTWVKKSDRDIQSHLIFQYPANTISANVALEFKFKGLNTVIPTACAAGNYAIGYAFDLLKSGKIDMAIAGGSDAFSRIAFSGFNSLYAVSADRCQPFDKNRKGMMLGEGAGIVILETLENALKRRAPIYSEVLGYGLSCDASHMTASTVQGIATCMQKALKYSDIDIDDVNYISAHGTGTQQNDKTECSAIKAVFNHHVKKIPVSSIKSMLGHTMGAAAAIETIACCLAIKDSIIPATINYETPDPECDIDCVPNMARKQKVSVVLNNSYAFGGNNACLVLRKLG
jgi:3-oxoacyl-[acyl-carrier-protein] synthase II